MANPTQAMVGGLFLMSVAEAFNVYSALNSSPWTAENFGADPEKAASCRMYVRHSTVVNLALGIGTSLVAGNSAPFWAIAAITGYMWWMYERALAKGAAAGTAGWANS